MDDLYMSEVAWKEYQSQDVFDTIETYIEAMPPGIRAVHLLSGDIADKIGGYIPIDNIKPKITASLCIHPDQKISMVWKDITHNLNRDIIKSSKECHVKLKKADPKIGRWTFSVTSGSGKTHTVHIKASIPKDTTASSVQKMDLQIGCTCDFWKWYGPDYHAKKHGYIDRKPRSDGSTPTERDPEGINRVCKHVYAASNYFLKYKIQKISSRLKDISRQLQSDGCDCLSEELIDISRHI